MADSFRVGIGDVPVVPGLGPDQGWVGMTVQFLVDATGAGAEHVVFGRAVFAPGQAEHQWHRPGDAGRRGAGSGPGARRIWRPGRRATRE